MTIATSMLHEKPISNAWPGARPRSTPAAATVAKAKLTGAQAKPQISTFSSPGASPRGHHLNAIKAVSAAMAQDPAITSAAFASKSPTSLANKATQIAASSHSGRQRT